MAVERPTEATHDSQHPNGALRRNLEATHAGSVGKRHILAHGEVCNAIRSG